MSVFLIPPRPPHPGIFSGEKTSGVDYLGLFWVKKLVDVGYIFWREVARSSSVICNLFSVYL